VAAAICCTSTGTYLGYRNIPRSARPAARPRAYCSRDRGLVGLALTRLRRRWRLSLAQWLGLTLAFALSLTIALTQTLAAEAGFSAVVAAAGPRGIVTVERTGARDAVAYAAFQQQVAS